MIRQLRLWWCRIEKERHEEAAKSYLLCMLEADRRGCWMQAREAEARSKYHTERLRHYRGLERRLTQ